ncbi:MAG: hypothetical protein R3D25_02455 [Geminicoccaceae bacterium]
MRTVPTRAGARRVPIGSENGTPPHPQLIIVAASLALWTIIIASCSFLLG